MKVTRLPRDPGTGCLELPFGTGTPGLRSGGTDCCRLAGHRCGISQGLPRHADCRELCPGDRIVVLEACRVAEGPAGRNSGFMIDLPHDLTSEDYGGALDHDMKLTADNRHAIGFAARMAQEFGLSDGSLCDESAKSTARQRRGVISTTRNSRNILNRWANPSRCLDGRQMREIDRDRLLPERSFHEGQR